MTDLSDLVLDAAVAARISAPTRRQALQSLSEMVARAALLEPRRVLDAITLRERLGGTGIGEGVAIPHAVIEGLAHPIGGFARLDPPADFAALDGRPADLVFMLLAPDGRAHLKALARISRFFRRGEVRERLRSARTHEELCAIFAVTLASDAA